MRYLAICCFVMLGIALAHAIPTQGLRSLQARTRAEHLFDVQSSLIDKLRSLMAKTSRQYQSQGSDSGSPPACSDECGFNDLRLLDPNVNFTSDIEDVMECAFTKVNGIENKFQEDFEKETGKPLFNEEELIAMWGVRASGFNVKVKTQMEVVWDNEALDRFEKAAVTPRPGLIKEYSCFRDIIYGFFEYLEYIISLVIPEEYDKLVEYPEYKANKAMDSEK